MFCFPQRIAQDAITAMGDMGRNARVSTRVSVGTRFSVYWHFLLFFLLVISKTKGAPIAQLGERRTLDRKVAGSILTRGAVLCP